MNITIVCDVLGEENNGTTIAAMNLIRHLESKKHNVKVLCADQDKINQKNFFVVPTLNVGPLNGLVKKNGVALANPKKKIISEALKDAELVHILLPFLLGNKALKMAKILNLPITASCHMQAENFSCQFKLQDKKWINNTIYKFVYKHTYRHVNAIHYPTQFIKDSLETAIKKKTKGYVISNGVNKFIKKTNIAKPEQFADKIVILSIGRYSREKAQSVLIDAIKLSKYSDKIQLILAGQGPTEAELKDKAKDLPNYPIFHFYARNEINDIINFSDIYVHPAEMELEGIACIEAISCGKLTIVCDSEKSATKNFAIDEKCMFKMRDPNDLAKKIDYWIEHEEEKKEYEKKYLNSAIAYDQDECMNKMEQMMFEVVSEFKKEQKN